MRLKLALPRQLSKPASNRIDRYDCEYKQQSDHNHWNADEYDLAVPSAEGGWTGGRLHSSKYGCRYMLELGKPRSNYQAQAGDEET